MTSPGIVYTDETAYPNLRLPANWTMHHEPVWGSLQASMQYVFQTYPDASRYGWLADDTVPRTHGWDKELERWAGDYGFAHARDLWHSEVDDHPYVCGNDMSAGLCWGGELVRTVGWWALPGVRQAGIDTAWTALIGPLGLCRYRRDVVVEHKHYRTGKRLQDDGDSWVRGTENYVAADIAYRNRWFGSQDFVDTLTRVAYTATVDPDRKRLHRLLVDAKLAGRTGMPAARLTNILTEFDAEVPELVNNILRAHTHSQPAPPSDQGDEKR